MQTDVDITDRDVAILHRLISAVLAIPQSNVGNAYELLKNAVQSANELKPLLVKLSANTQAQKMINNWKQK